MKVISLLFLFQVILTICGHKLNHDYTNRLIIWNVGQGQWLTYIKNNYCYHMDMGGEYAPIKTIYMVCKNKLNWIYISHADRDHINFYRKFSKLVSHHCLVRPNKNFLKQFKLKKNKIKLCPTNKTSPVTTIYSPRFKITKSKNELSKVFIIENKILNPGDSLIKNELYWANKKQLKDIRILILGHHGSQTSSSDYLIKKLSNLKYSIASARKNRYGHPHGRVRLKMQMNKTPTLSTEQWSHITILL